MKCYRFVEQNLTSQHGSIHWEIGKWQKHEGHLALCTSGFHASKRPIDSLHYVFGTRWFHAEARGTIIYDDDKFVASEMRLVREIPVKVVQQFAIDFQSLNFFPKFL